MNAITERKLAEGRRALTEMGLSACPDCGVWIPATGLGSKHECRESNSSSDALSVVERHCDGSDGIKLWIEIEPIHRLDSRGLRYWLSSSAVVGDLTREADAYLSLTLQWASYSARGYFSGETHGTAFDVLEEAMRYDMMAVTVWAQSADGEPFVAWGFPGESA